MTKGWCPVHDRIVESRDGTCPECGRPLVDLAAHPRDAAESRLVVEEEQEPDAAAAERPPTTETALWPEIRLPPRIFGRDSISIGPVAIATILIAAVAGSFLVGRAIPRVRGGEDTGRDVREVRADHTVGVLRPGPGAFLRLESVSQRGFHITIRVIVDESSEIDVGRIQSVDVTPILEGRGETPQAMNLEARTTVSSHTRAGGFVAEGNLAMPPTVRVKGIRIDTLYLSAKEGADFPLDLSRLGPASSDVPRVKVVRSPTRSAGTRDYQISDIVGWPDRLEVRFYRSADRQSWFPDEVFSLVQPNADLVDGFVIEQTNEAEFVHVVFRVSPPWSKRSVVRITVRGLSITGGWAWELG